ncbi:MAG: SufE family protein [Paludibacteraceae bacterium]|nr:SufE family protein [Paludibacteraceae bacterium]MBQ2064506.1 SufE family protein [Paludibacteraceae bacterium]MBQ5524549.1 SufE family protein [Paludibacteraceae bacterium]
MNINEKQDQIIEDFSAFEEWFDKYSYLIELGNSLDILPEEKKTEENIIRGCQSRVWLDAEQKPDGNVIFKGDSDAVIVKGILSLLISVMSDQPAADIAGADLYFIERIGLKEHLSPTRSNGLLAMVKQMKIYGLAYSQKNN